MKINLDPRTWFHSATVESVRTVPPLVAAYPEAAELLNDPQPAPAAIPEEDNHVNPPNAFVSWLANAGKNIRAFLHIGIDLAQKVEPIVDLAVPEIATLYNTVVGLCVAAEATALTATGSGTQKLADVVGKIGPEAAALFGNDKAKITAYVNAVVQTLNVIPSKASA